MAYVNLVRTERLGVEVRAECRVCGCPLLADATVQPYRSEIVVQVARCASCGNREQDNQQQGGK